MRRLTAASWLLIALLALGPCIQHACWAATQTAEPQDERRPQSGDSSLQTGIPDLNGGFDDLHYGPWLLVEVVPQEPPAPAPAPTAPPAEEAKTPSTPPPAPVAEETIDPQIIEQAKEGNAVAQYKLGYAYYLGRGIAQDYTQAAIWWRMAAEQGDPRAQNNLGVLYNSGKGLPQSYSEAYFWQNLAAARANGPLQVQFAKNRDESAAKLSIWERLRVQKRAAKWAAEHPVPAKPAAKAKP